MGTEEEGKEGNGENKNWVTPGHGGKRHTDHVRKGTGGKAQGIGNK